MASRNRIQQPYRKSVKRDKLPGSGEIRQKLVKGKQGAAHIRAAKIANR